MSRSYGSSSSEIKSKQIDSPLDTVQQIVWDPFRPNERGFLVASWDGFIRYYFIKGTSYEEIVKSWQFFLGHPVLSCDITNSMIVVVGLATGQIVAISMQNNQAAVIGTHNAPICATFWVERMGLLISVGIDNMLKFWTLNSPNNQFLQLEKQLPQKIFCASFDDPYIFLCSKSSKLAMVSIAGLPNTLIIPTSFQQIQNVEFFSKFNACKVNALKKHYTCGAVDGRLLIGQFTEQNNFAFKFQPPTISKTQKKDNYRKLIMGQINAVDIGLYNSAVYYIMGGTNQLTIYNIVKKQKAKNIMPPISKHNFTAVALNPMGDYMAYATGNDWNEGIRQLEISRKPKIYVLKFTNQQLKSFITNEK